MTLIKGTAPFNTPFARSAASAQLTIRVTVFHTLLIVILQNYMHSVNYMRTEGQGQLPIIVPSASPSPASSPMG
jgi:hypothetical protein